MTDKPLPLGLTKPTDEIAALVARAAHYSKSTIADRTRKAYEVEFAHFRRWAEERGLPAMPATVEVVSVYLAALADGNVEIHWHDRSGRERVSKRACKYATIQHAHQAVIYTMKTAGLDWPSAHPAITKVMRGIRYRNGTTPKRMAPQSAT